MESTLFKITATLKYSGIFYGPMTTVYGVGIVAILLLNKYVFSKLKCNKLVKILIEFIILLLVLTLIEFLGGNILKLIFNIDMWDYSKKNFNYGKYICLELSIIWGLLGVIFIYFIKPFTDKILSVISDRLTVIFLTIFLIDLMLVVVTKILIIYKM